MDYDTALALKKAGYPYPKFHERHQWDDVPYDEVNHKCGGYFVYRTGSKKKPYNWEEGKLVYIPNLHELLNSFSGVDIVLRVCNCGKKPHWMTHCFDYPMMKWVTGETAEIAVAKLWMELKKKKYDIVKKPKAK